MTNKWRTINSFVHKLGFTVDEGKERLWNSSREKNKGMHRRRKVDEKSCVIFRLCDPPAGTSNELDVQKNGKKTQKTHTHTLEDCC